METKPEYVTADDKTILRKPHNKENPYVVISKTVFEDTALSWKAKGMMGYLLSRPDDWTILLGDLVKRSPEGRDAVRSILRELEEHGYIYRHDKRDEKGHWAPPEMIVLEAPLPPEQRTRSTRSGKPASGNPETDNPTLLSIDHELSNELTKEEPALPDSPPSEDAHAHIGAGTPFQNADQGFAIWPTEVDALGEEPPPEEESFYLEGETPTAPAVPRTAEQVKAGVRRAVEAFHNNGGQRAGVADPTKDLDPWMDRPVKEWCAFIRLSYDKNAESRNRLFADDLKELLKDTDKTPEEVGEAIRKMTQSTSCAWMRTAGRPTHKGFSEVLLNVLYGQVLPEGGNGRHDSATSGEKKEAQQQVIQSAMDSLFDPETGKRRELM